ncbi:hypothetical protein ZWY2020_005404 [Hordeum vulgare]|nr:hypothetical protein ZWY2020_005404 [Hordeum vulgare]
MTNMSAITAGHNSLSLSLPREDTPPLRAHRQHEVSHPPHSSQPLLAESVAEVSEDPFELSMVAGRGAKDDAEARDSSPLDRRPWQSCVGIYAPGAFLSISVVDGSHHRVDGLRCALPCPRVVAVPQLLVHCKCKPVPVDDLFPKCLSYVLISDLNYSPLSTSANPQLLSISV